MRERLKIHHPLESLGIVSAVRGDIRVERLQDRLNPKVPFPHKHDFYQIVFVPASKKAGWHQIDFTRYPVDKTQCFVIKPGQVHGWHLKPKTKGLIVEFTIESLSGETSDPDFSSSILATLPDEIKVSKRDELEDLLALLNLMRKEFQLNKPKSHQALKQLLKTFLILLSRCGSKSIPRDFQVESVVEMFRHLVEQNFRTDRSVEFYSQKMGLTSKALTMRILRATGKSARHFIQERILLEAKRLLAYTKATVSEIAYDLGFEDPNYFARFFREQTGVTPLHFRKSRP